MISNLEQNHIDFSLYDFRCKVKMGYHQG